MDSDQSVPDAGELGKCKTEIKVEENHSENKGQIISTELNMEIGNSIQENTEKKTEELETDIVKKEEDVTSFTEDIVNKTAKDISSDDSNTADEKNGNKKVKDESVKSSKGDTEIVSEPKVPEVTTKTEPSLMGYRGDDEESDSESDSSSDDDSSSDMETNVDESSKSDKPETKTSESLNDRSGPKMCQNSLIKSMREEIRTRGEVFPDELPPIEDLTIRVEESEELMTVGKVTGIVDTLVVIKSETGVPALNEDSILFKANREVFGKIFEVFGPVCSPLYSVRFNSGEDIKKCGVEIGHQVYCAPRKTELTQYVFVDQLKTIKGSDASWEDNHEPPERFVEYSDDEEERKAKSKNRKSRHGQGGRVEESGTEGGPPQRVPQNNRCRQHSSGMSNKADRQHGYTGEENPPTQFHSQQNIHPHLRQRPRFADYQDSGPFTAPQGGRPFTASQRRGPFTDPQCGGPSTAPRQMHPGMDMPHRFSVPPHMARPQGMSPSQRPQQFAGPPQFRKGPNCFPSYQPQLPAPMFGGPEMPQFGQYQEYNSYGFGQNSSPYGGVENPPMRGAPPQNRTSLLGRSSGSVGFGGVEGYGGTFPAPGMVTQRGIPHRQYGYSTFEHQRQTVPDQPPPIDRRYIQKS
ncbi:H/ACA ribonucleoprotein complex non-core subunit NAF1-like [Liolophura sinensis]|uniref:H/ACA ribonucleoprotein complex non-core subunit NAF1-like n=1 Tax=Liolophura sinensis TaxID=3198878 RepID=UPI00315802AD